MAYCIQDDVELIFGEDNVAEWADADNDGDATKKANRITRCILMSDAEINAVLRTAGYTYPPADATGTTPTLVMMLSAVGTGMWLYESDGAARMTPGSEPIHQYSYLKTWRRRTLQAIAAGKLKMDAE